MLSIITNSEKLFGYLPKYIKNHDSLEWWFSLHKFLHSILGVDFLSNPFYTLPTWSQHKMQNNMSVVQFFKICHIASMPYFPSILIFFQYPSQWKTKCIFLVFKKELDLPLYIIKFFHCKYISIIPRYSLQLFMMSFFIWIRQIWSVISHLFLTPVILQIFIVCINQFSCLKHFLPSS